MDMAELLKNNMEVKQCLQESEVGPNTQMATKQEIPDL